MPSILFFFQQRWKTPLFSAGSKGPYFCGRRNFSASADAAASVAGGGYCGYGRRGVSGDVCMAGRLFSELLGVRRHYLLTGRLWKVVCGRVGRMTK